jgi:hypothetical protein
VTAAKVLESAQHISGFMAIVLGPSQRQAAEWFKKFRDFRDNQPQVPRLMVDNNLSCEFSNGSRVIALPSTEATVRGFSRVNLLVMDEAARIPDDLYRAVRPMLAVSGGQLILLTTPFGKRGFFWEAWDKGKGRDWEAQGGEMGEWLRYTVPWQLCPRITPEFIAEERAESGELWVQQEYECQFNELLGRMFGYDLIRSALTDDIEPLFAKTEGADNDGAAFDIDRQEEKIQEILGRMLAAE